MNAGWLVSDKGTPAGRGVAWRIRHQSELFVGCLNSRTHSEVRR